MIVAKYIVKGFEFTFIDVHFEAGYKRGYCKLRHMWATLFDQFFQFDDGGIFIGEKIYEGNENDKNNN